MVIYSQLPVCCVSWSQCCPGIRQSEETGHRNKDSSGKCDTFCKADGPVAEAGGGLQPVPQGESKTCFPGP